MTSTEIQDFTKGLTDPEDCWSNFSSLHPGEHSVIYECGGQRRFATGDNANLPLRARVHWQGQEVSLRAREEGDGAEARLLLGAATYDALRWERVHERRQMLVRDWATTGTHTMDNGISALHSLATLATVAEKPDGYTQAVDESAEQARRVIASNGYYTDTARDPGATAALATVSGFPGLTCGPVDGGARVLISHEALMGVCGSCAQTVGQGARLTVSEHLEGWQLTFEAAAGDTPGPWVENWTGDGHLNLLLPAMTVNLRGGRCWMSRSSDGAVARLRCTLPCW